MSGRVRPRPRPDTSPTAVKQTLIDLGHPASWAGPVASDFRIIVPLLLLHLGADEINTMIRDDLVTYQLSDAVIRESAQSLVQWAEQVMKTFGEQPR